MMGPYIKNDFYREKKIMILGHTGFVGSWLTKILLTLRAQIAGYSLDPPTNPNIYSILNIKERILDIRGNILTRESLERAIKNSQPEIIFHFAAQPIALESFKYLVETLKTNIIGTANVLNSIRRLDSVEVALIMTSDKVYHNNKWPSLYREINPLGGREPYGARKSCKDLVVNSFRESFFKPLGVRISTVRAGNTIGGGDWGKYRLITDIVKRIDRGKTIKIRNPESIKPQQYILDIIDGMLLLTKKSYNDEKFSGDWNFSPDNSRIYTVKEIVNKFIGTLEGKFEFEKRWARMKSHLLSLDFTKARDLLGWYPTFDLDRAITSTVEWYKAYYLKSNSITDLTDKMIKSYFERVVQ
ncbi:MAG: CDP-glucose 4,6-dehydratase [Thermoplasmatales archaeon]